jgi:putative membrane protein
MKRWSSIGLFILLVLFPGVVYAQPESAVTPVDFWTRWSLNPVVITGLFLAVWLYGRGLITIRDYARVERGVHLWQIACFIAGVVVLAVALLSPLNALGVTLFSAHIVQQVILMVVAPPLLMLSGAVYVFSRSIPIPWRWKLSRIGRIPLFKGIGYGLRQPFIVWTLHTVVLWLWHVPDLYDLSLRSAFFHMVELLSIFGLSLLYWSLLTAYRRCYLRVLLLFASTIQTILLGAVITLSSTPWHPVHLFYVEQWGLTALVDQQLAGILFTLAASSVYLMDTVLLRPRHPVLAVEKAPGIQARMAHETVR